MCLLCLKERTSLARPLTSAKCQKESVHGKLVVQHRPKTNKRWNAAAFEQSQFFDHTGSVIDSARIASPRTTRGSQASFTEAAALRSITAPRSDWTTASAPILKSP